MNVHVYQLRTTMASDLRPSGLANWLAVASALELLLLRVFTRSAIHIPGLQELAAPYQVVAFGARYAYFVAVVLLVMVLPVLALALSRMATWPSRALSAGVAAFGVAAVAAFAGADRMPADAVILGVIVWAAAVAAMTAGRGTALALGCFGGAFGLSGALTLVQEVTVTVPLQEQRLLLYTIEVLGVAAALTLPFAVRWPFPRASLYTGAAAGLITFSMFVSGGGATARILLLWNEGLTGTLPAVVYAAAAAAVAATLVALLRQHDLTRAAAVTLLLAGGIGLHSTYQSGLVVIGLAMFLLHALEGHELRSASLETSDRRARLAVAKRRS